MKTVFIKELQAVYKAKTELKQSQVKNRSIAADWIKDVWPVDITHREAFACIFLNRKNDTIGYSVVSIGGVSATTVDVKIIYQNALLCNASSIILVHNHPAGTTKPSDADIGLTTKVTKAGKLLDINVLDHIIITETEQYSFADNGLI